jgi:hypothetical protein
MLDTTGLGITVFHLDDGRDELLGCVRFSPPVRRGEEKAIFSLDQSLVELEG